MKRLIFVVLAAGLWIGPLSAQQPPPRPTAAQEGFVPVESLPGQEQMPAAPLVMTAYGVAWLAAFGYLWSIWQRLARVEREIAVISKRVEAGSRR
jgi:CcmD family protein